MPKANSSITSLTPEGASNATDLSRVLSAARITVNNHFDTLAELNAHLDGLDLLDEGRLRPGWDLYFMVSSMTIGRKLIIDSCIAGRPPLQLHEASCWGRARPLQAYSQHRLQWYCAWYDQLQRGRMLEV